MNVKAEREGRLILRWSGSLGNAKSPVESRSIKRIKYATLFDKMHQRRTQCASFRRNRGQLLRRPFVGNRLLAGMQCEMSIFMDQEKSGSTRVPPVDFALTFRDQEDGASR